MGCYLYGCSDGAMCELISFVRMWGCQRPPSC